MQSTFVGQFTFVSCQTRSENWEKRREKKEKEIIKLLTNFIFQRYFKKCGRIEEQIELLKQKLRLIYQGEAFNGRLTMTARSHGKKFQVSIKQETARLLGNLCWAYMQKTNYMMAEVVFKKAQMIDADANKACNLVLCLMRQSRYEEESLILEYVLQ